MKKCPHCLEKKVVTVRGKYKSDAYEWTGEKKVYVHTGMEPHDTTIITSNERIVTGKRVAYSPRWCQGRKLIPEVWRGWPARIHKCEEGEKHKEELAAACTGQDW